MKESRFVFLFIDELPSASLNRHLQAESMVHDTCNSVIRDGKRRRRINNQSSALAVGKRKIEKLIFLMT